MDPDCKDANGSIPADGEFSDFLERIAHLRHEINNPLMGILGHAELLLDDPDLPDNIRVRAEKMQTEARKIMNCVQEMGQVVRKFRG